MMIMAKTISASAMRDRLLAPVKTSVPSDDWMRVLGVPGHRELLGLIARHRPPSIGALAELAGRAQPNVSRALVALVSAGLVTVVVSGRRSTPQITDRGATHARELGLLDEIAASSDAPPASSDLFSIEPQANTSEVAGNDAITGTLVTWLWLTSSREQVPARSQGDLDALARRVLENWWRLLYRRDAPFRLWEFVLDQHANTNFALLATVLGSQISLQARSTTGRRLDLEHGSRLFAIAAFEEHLLEELLRPLASRHWLEGRSARPLHALLRRIEDSREQPAERAFCRAAGALGLSPYDLAGERAGQIRDLIDLIADEDARLDFSSAVLADALGEGQLWTRHELDRFRERNAMPALMKLRQVCTANFNALARPFRQGYALARSAREFLQVAEDEPIGGVEGIGKLLGVDDGLALSPDAPGTLRAFQSLEGEAPTFIVEDEGPRASAFTLARGVGDFLAFGSPASCVADLYTDRQAVGRAFAAEFMAPRSAVVEMVEHDDQPISRIADHFGVSASVVHRQYQNAIA
jgi:DNA-binding MarR family transcriptional regulator